MNVNTALDLANPEDFDAVLHPGGTLNADNLRVEKKAQEFVRKINQAGSEPTLASQSPFRAPVSQVSEMATIHPSGSFPDG